MIRKVLVSCVVAAFFVAPATMNAEEAKSGETESKAAGEKSTADVKVIAEKTRSSEKKTSADDSKTSAENKERIKVAYNLSRKVMTIGDLEQIVATLAEVDTDSLSTKDADYITSLESWAWNSKGKRLLDDIQRLEKINKLTEADETLKQAREALDLAIEKNPKRDSSFHLRGIVLSLQEDYDAAIVDFDQANRLKPGQTKVWFNRAEVYYAKGEFESAIDDYSSVLEKNASDVQALTGRAHCYLQLGQVEDAIVDYQAVVAQQANDSGALTNLADCMQIAGRWEEADSTFRSALIASTENALTYQRVAWLYATCPDQQYQKPQIALQAIKRAIELSGTEGEKNLEVLAAVHAANGDFELAKRTQNRAIELAKGERATHLKKALERFAENKPFHQSANQRDNERR